MLKLLGEFINQTGFAVHSRLSSQLIPFGIVKQLWLADLVELAGLIRN
jgi:hypothetical protein